MDLTKKYLMLQVSSQNPSQGWDLSTRHGYERQDIIYDELISDMPEINVTNYITHAS
jgi:hypothetical protein